MAVSRRRLFLFVAAAYAVVACSLITDYSLNGKAGGDAGQSSESGPNDGGDEGTTVETGPLPDVVLPEEDAGPTCTDTPCIVQIAPAGREMCALKSDGSVYCWGTNGSGVVKVAPGDTEVPQKITFPYPLNGIPIAQVAAGDWGRQGGAACARGNTGVIECWGQDGKEHRLGRSDTDGGGFYPVPEAVANVASATDLAIGAQRACAITGGKLMCWGKDYDNVVSLAKDVPTPRMPVRVYSGRCGDCVILDNGDLACAGYPFVSKELWSVDGGNGPGQAAFVTMPGVSNVVEIAYHGNHLCVRENDGSIWCWGRNDKGQLGRGTTGSINNTPTKVTLPMPAKRLGSSADATCAALVDGSLWCWGRNNSGTNYDGTVHATGIIGPNPDGGPAADDLIVPSPRKIDGLPTNAGLIRQIAGGYEHMCVIYQSGALYCWGGNRHGQLSLPANNNPNPTPVKVSF